MGNMIIAIIALVLFSIIGGMYYLLLYLYGKIAKIKRDLSYSETVALNLRNILIDNAKETNKSLKKVADYLYNIEKALKDNEYIDNTYLDTLIDEAAEDIDDDIEDLPFIEIYNRQIEQATNLYNEIESTKIDYEIPEISIKKGDTKIKYDNEIPEVWK